MFVLLAVIPQQGCTPVCVFFLCNFCFCAFQKKTLLILRSVSTNLCHTSDFKALSSTTDSSYFMLMGPIKQRNRV